MPLMLKIFALLLVYLSSKVLSCVELYLCVSDTSYVCVTEL